MGLLLPRQETISYAPRHVINSPALQRGQLRWPIIIPLRDAFNGDSSWMRAYLKPLINDGIDQQIFLNVLDSFEVQIKVRTALAISSPVLTYTLALDSPRGC
jgi:hypothetical protein